MGEWSKGHPGDKRCSSKRVSRPDGRILSASRCFAQRKMAGRVVSKNFSGQFSGLNGVASLTATHPDIIRSLLTVGYPSRRVAVRKVGVWRERMLVAMATGYLDRSLRTTRYFRDLEQTEKVGVSFLLGEAFTHWYAQNQMSVEYLVHVAGLSTCKWVAPSVGVAPKQGASAPAPKSRPDFIGIGRRERHVLESKAPHSAAKQGRGRKGARPSFCTPSRSMASRCRKQRCASFFMLRESGAEGLVVDPPEEGDGVGVVFDELEALQKAYSFFLEGPTISLADQVGEGYVGREIEDGVFFCADKQILDALEERPTSEPVRRQRVTDIFGILSERAHAYESRREPMASPGLDGTLLVDRR